MDPHGLTLIAWLVFPLLLLCGGNLIANEGQGNARYVGLALGGSAVVLLLSIPYLFPDQVSAALASSF